MTKIVDDFTKHFAGITDPKERERLITRIKMAAVQTAPDEAMKPPVRTLGEYLAAPIEVPPTLIYPAIVVRGEITATLGRAGIGKTTMNLQRIIMWATGQPMYEDWKDQHGISYMSTDNDRPIKTLIIENEGSAGMFHHKMGHLLTREGRLTDEQRNLAKENILIWGDGGYSGLKLDNDKNVSQVKAACDEWEPDILFVEPFRGLWTGEENSATDMAIVVDNMIDIATEFDCGIILSHHERKSGVGDDGELMSAGRGSTVLEGAVATMENYQKVRGGDYREMTWSKKRYLHTPPPLRLEYDPLDTWYNYVPAELIEDQIIQVLTEAEGGPLSGSDIAELIEETKTKTNGALRKLTEAGRIKRRNGGQRPNGGGSRGYVYTLSGYSGSGDGGLEI